MLYDIKVSISLEPVWHRDPPHLIVSCHDRVHDLRLRQPSIIEFDFRAAGQQAITIQLLNKTNDDSKPDLGLDKLVIIRDISFFGIADPRFIWRGIYRPQYPEPWYSQQVLNHQPPQTELTNVDRLSWNGTWILQFDLPVFKWIHQVQNLGWIYS